MGRFANRDWIAGALLVIVGLFLLAGRFTPGVERLIPLLVGLALLGLFFVTRSAGALIQGGIVTGVGVGILVATQGDPAFGGAGFLIAVGAGFILVSFLGAVYQISETRYWPLVPGSILISLGALIFAGKLGQQVLQFAADWWPLLLVAVGAWLLVAARFRRPLADHDDEETRPGVADEGAVRAAEERRAAEQRAAMERRAAEQRAAEQQARE